MVEVDYAKLGKLLELSGISRRKMAVDTGISENSIAGSFRRHSKMKTAYLIRIANYFGVSPSVLLKTNADGKPNSEDLEQIDILKQSETDIDRMIEDFDIEWIVEELKKLNQPGHMKVQEYIELLLLSPAYRKDSPEEHDSGEE